MRSCFEEGLSRLGHADYEQFREIKKIGFPMGQLKMETTDG
jgi:hypothetical protein